VDVLAGFGNTPLFSAGDRLGSGAVRDGSTVGGMIRARYLDATSGCISVFTDAAAGRSIQLLVAMPPVPSSELRSMPGAPIRDEIRGRVSSLLQRHCARQLLQAERRGHSARRPGSEWCPPGFRTARTGESSLGQMPGLRRSMSRTSRQRQWCWPRRSRVPTTRNPAAWCRARLAVFSGKIRDWMVQIPAASVEAVNALPGYSEDTAQRAPAQISALAGDQATVPGPCAEF
jgi:hypothetical protein